VHAWRGTGWRARVVIARAGRIARAPHRWTHLHPSVRASVRPSDDRIDDDASTIHPSTTSTTTDHRRRRFLAARVEKIFFRRAIFFVCARRRGAFSF